MENPWVKLSSDGPEYVLDDDKECICHHNASASFLTRFEPESIPEPFIGNPATARVAFLGKNPGHREGAEEEYKRNKELCAAMFSNLRHDLADYPFYPLNPDFARTGAGEWWSKRTAQLQEALDGDLRKLSERMMVIEWFPYHSMRFRVPKIDCPSQQYSFQLVQDLFDRDVLVVGMRAANLWARFDGVRSLGLRYLKNPQCGHISRGNTDGKLFDEIVSSLKR